MKHEKAPLLPLFFTMLKIGAFTFGGGYAMIALLENELVSKKKWIEKEEFLNMVAIAESTPGPVAVNSATYVGYKIGGVFGSVCATLGVVLPSFVIIFLISLFFERFLALTAVAAAFRGIKVCVIYLILSAGLKMLGGLPHSIFAKITVTVVCALMVTLSLCDIGISSVVYILVCGTIGVVIDRVAGMPDARGEEHGK